MENLIIQRTDNEEGDADGCNFLGGFFYKNNLRPELGVNLQSPFWVLRNRAPKWELAEGLARSLSANGYSCRAGVSATSEKDSILLEMKNGTLSKEEGVKRLKALAKVQKSS